VERKRVETGVDLIRQRLDVLRWDYTEQPGTDPHRRAWEAGLALPDAELWAIARALINGT
jgi:hypothetical protein